MIVPGRRRAHGVRAALARPHARGHDRQRLRGRRSSTCRHRTTTSPTCSTRSTRFFGTDIGPGDLTGAYAGVRPLISTGDPKKSVDISRRAELYETSSGLVTITGGKLTTWRRMAKMAVDRIVEREGREAPCRTHEIPLGLPRTPARCRTVPGVDEESRAHLAARYGHAARDVLGWRSPRRSSPRASARSLPDLVAEAAFAARPRAGALAGRRAAAPHAAGAARRARRWRRRTPRARVRAARALAGELGWDDARIEQELRDWREVARREGLVPGGTAACGRGRAAPEEAA